MGSVEVVEVRALVELGLEIDVALVRQELTKFLFWPAAGGGPAGLIDQHEGVGIRPDGDRYFGQMQRHGLGVAVGQEKLGLLALFRADRADDIGRFRPLILGCRWLCPPTLPSAV
jgi:hypothetical protein